MNGFTAVTRYPPSTSRTLPFDSSQSLAPVEIRIASDAATPALASFVLFHQANPLAEILPAPAHNELTSALAAYRLADQRFHEQAIVVPYRAVPMDVFAAV